MKLLNLDELVAPEKVIRIKNVDHTVIERTVGQVLEAVKFEKSGKSLNDNETFETAIDFVLQSIPTCPKEDLLSLQVESIGKILSFINDADTQVVEEGKEGK